MRIERRERERERGVNGWRWMQINWWIWDHELCHSLSDKQWNVPPTWMESIFQPGSDCLLIYYYPDVLEVFHSVFFSPSSLNVIQFYFQMVWRTDSLSYMQNDSIFFCIEAKFNYFCLTGTSCLNKMHYWSFNLNSNRWYYFVLLHLILSNITDVLMYQIFCKEEESLE